MASVNCACGGDPRRVLAALTTVIAASEGELGRLYVTHENGEALAVNYFVWSDVFTCPECGHEFAFFPHGVIHYGNKVETRAEFPCPACRAPLNVRRVQRVLTGHSKKKALVWVNAGTRGHRVNRAPNHCDFRLAAEIEATIPEAWYPQDTLSPDGYSAKLAQLGEKAVTEVSRFLSKRNLIVFADLWARVSDLPDAGVRQRCRATLTSIFTVISERQGYFGGGGGMSGNLYMPIIRMEKNVYDVLRRKLKKLEDAERARERLPRSVVVSTQSATNLESIPDAAVDYIYTDPPFGANIIYSEVNLILEAWLRVKTGSQSEAVVDRSRNRGFDEYAALMRACFQEYYRVLKPGRWMTVEFHNTMADIWNLVQTAIGESGFIVADVGVLDKGSTTILADIRPGAARCDLIISAYRPDGESTSRFELTSGTEAGVWDFVRERLRELPVTTGRDGAERGRHLLFDRMVAFHLQRGVTMPLSAARFYAGLAERFPERDGQYFLPDQVAAYDVQRS